MRFWILQRVSNLFQGQSLHPSAGIERPVSFAGEDRRRDFPDVPGFSGDSAGDQRPHYSTADSDSSGDRLARLSRHVRLPNGADSGSFDPGQFYSRMDLRRRAQTGVHRRARGDRPRDDQNRGNARVDQGGKSLRNRSVRGAALRQRELERLHRRPPRATDARGLSRHHQHGTRGRVRRRGVRRSDGGARRWNRGHRARRSLARIVPGIDRALRQHEPSHAQHHRPLGQHAGRRGRDFARARDARQNSGAEC